MHDLLPSLPGQAALPGMALWAAGGAAALLGMTAWQWITKPGAFGEVVREQQLHIPGAPAANDPYPPPWSAEGLRAAAYGAVVGALMGWGWSGAEATRDRVHFMIEAFVATAAVWTVARTLRDAPVVGEAPPEEALGKRRGNALGKLALAAVALLIAWESIR